MIFRWSGSKISEVSQVFFFEKSPPGKSWKNNFSGIPWNQGPSGPPLDARAPNSVQDSLNESSVRPNGTSVMPVLRSWAGQKSGLVKNLCKFNRGKKAGAPPAHRKIVPEFRPKLVISHLCLNYCGNLTYIVIFYLVVSPKQMNRLGKKPPYDQMAPQLCQFYVPGQPSKRQFVKKHGLVATKTPAG